MGRRSPALLAQRDSDPRSRCSGGKLSRRAGLQARAVRHLILCREYPPSPYAAGGIGTYVHHIARLLAEAGETVHVIGQQWAGAPQATERRHDGRLTIHRVPLDEPVAVPWHENDPETAKVALAGLLRSES